ncbi:helix-turn-helix domain-containing protein [Nocardia sp. NPDC004860]
MSSRAAAQRLGVSASTVKRWRKASRLIRKDLRAPC